MIIKYMNFLPGGNKTALVIGDDYDADDRRKINDAIMASDPEIEQVGFVRSVGIQDNGDKAEDERALGNVLNMAGGEFCGNATRSAAFYYLKGQPGDLTMTVSGGRQVACGVYENGDAWCQIPLSDEAGAAESGDAVSQSIQQLAPGIHRVALSGITHLVLEPEIAAPYLKNREMLNQQDACEKLKQQGMTLIEKYGLKDQEAAGAIFTERLPGGSLKINPIVWVRDIASLFYETACGSGTVATAMVLAQKEGCSRTCEILQPSGMSINAEITVTRAVISGPVFTDLIPKTLQL